MSRRIGLFGGTFDPPHVGHLALAECAREALALDRVVFMPAGAPPHKRGRALSPAAARLAMTRLAVRGNPAFEVSAWETRRPGPSFTVDTLRWLARRHPGARLWLVLGADSLDEFPTWHRPHEILGLASLAVGARPGARAGGRGAARAAHAAPRGARRGMPRGRVVWLGNPPLDLSSSAVRARARAGRSIRYLVPDAVARYAERHGLYRAARGGGA
uniref:Probable nicotinate-nucleotide adenylyltransferase n=1 Tax=Eiseniibacteriota bacterium TaxID=2212470 RepID=A0A832HZW1_UNCEI